MGMLERLEIKLDGLKDTLKAEIKTEIMEEIGGEIGNVFREDLRDQEEKIKRERNLNLLIKYLITYFKFST